MEKTIRNKRRKERAEGRKEGRTEGRKEGRKERTPERTWLLAGGGGGGGVGRTDGRQTRRHVCFHLHNPPAPPPGRFFPRRRRFPRTNPEVLDGSDLSRTPVPDWSASIFPAPRPLARDRRVRRARRRSPPPRTPFARSPASPVVRRTPITRRAIRPGPENVGPARFLPPPPPR